MSAYPSLTRALAEMLVDLTWFIEGADEESMDQDDAVKALEGVAAAVGALNEGQRAELLGLVTAMAAAEPDTRRREFLAGFAEGFGLVE